MTHLYRPGHIAKANSCFWEVHYSTAVETVTPALAGCHIIALAKASMTGYLPVVSAVEACVVTVGELEPLWDARSHTRLAVACIIMITVTMRIAIVFLGTTVQIYDFRVGNAHWCIHWRRSVSRRREFNVGIGSLRPRRCWMRSRRSYQCMLRGRW